MDQPTSAGTAAAAASVRNGSRARRIALVISSLSGGGAERVVAALARRWVAAGDEVTVVTLASSDRDTYALPPGAKRVELGLVRPSRSVVEGAVRSAGRVRALRRALVHAAPELVVSLISATNVLALLAAAGTGIPVFVCERSDPRTEPISRIWGALRRAVYPRAAGVVVQTEAVAAWARTFCERVHVVPNFVERPARVASPGAERGPWRLLAMGRLGPEKGFDLLLRAFARIAASHPGWTLEILGEGSERPALEALRDALGLNDRVSLPGHARDPVAHLAAAHAFALSSRYEGFPNALLEAMACGLPVVAFSCPSGPADIVTHGVDGLLVAPGDVGAFSDALQRLLGSPAERARLGERAREVTTRLGPDRILERWAAVLTSREESAR